MTTPNALATRSGTTPQPPRPFTNRIFDGPAGRILCVADVRGHHSLLNQLSAETNAKAIIHTGDFGFFENSSLERINDRTLRHLLLYSPLIPNSERETLYPKDAAPEALRNTVKNSPPHLSEFPLLLSGKLKLNVPVYTVWGACEDYTILEKLRLGDYDVENLHIIDEATSRTLDIGGVRLRLFGLGGAFVPHKLFDNGEGSATIAGGAGTMWTTALQIGELVDTAQKTFDQTETRLLITHASPGREGLLAQLAIALKADLTISASLHFRYGSSWNEFSVQGDVDAYRTKLLAGQVSFKKVWDSVSKQVESVMDENQKLLLEKAVSVADRVPLQAASTASEKEEPAWKNTWNWNLCDASSGHLVLDIRDGRVSAEMKSQGFNYAYRRAQQTGPPSSSTPAVVNKPLSSAPSPAPTASSAAPLQTSTATEQAKSVPNGAPSSAPSPDPAAAKSPASSKTPQLPSATQATNGVNGDPLSQWTASPKSPAVDVGRNTSSPVPGSAKQKRNAEKRKTAKERAAGETDGGSKPASPAPGTPNATLTASGSKHGKKGSRASAGVASPSSAPSPVATPGPEANKPQDGSVRDLKSPPPQARNPGGGAGRRHPWTLYLSKLPIPVTEQEVRDCFGEANSSITFVKLPFAGNGPHRTQKPIAFVEFKDEETMQAALNQSSKVIKEQQIGMSIADNRDRPTPADDQSQGQPHTPAWTDPAQDGVATSPTSGGTGRGGMPSRGSFRGRNRGGLFAQARGALAQNARGGRKGSIDRTSPTPA